MDPYHKMKMGRTSGQQFEFHDIMSMYVNVQIIWIKSSHLPFFPLVNSIQKRIDLVQEGPGQVTKCYEYMSCVSA